MTDEVGQQLECGTIIDISSGDPIRNLTANIPVGKTGDCDLCGEWAGRLVNGICAPCCDKFRLL